MFGCSKPICLDADYGDITDNGTHILIYDRNYWIGDNAKKTFRLERHADHDILAAYTVMKNTIILKMVKKNHLYSWCW